MILLGGSKPEIQMTQNIKLKRLLKDKIAELEHTAGEYRSVKIERGLFSVWEKRPSLSDKYYADHCDKKAEEYREILAVIEEGERVVEVEWESRFGKAENHGDS